jgi:hypothetical protein
MSRSESNRSAAVEKEAASLLRAWQKAFQNRPAVLRERLPEIITRYPGTQAAREAQRLLESSDTAPLRSRKK